MFRKQDRQSGSFCGSFQHFGGSAARADADLHTGPVLFEMTCAAEAAEYTLVCIVADRAGVIDQKIGVFRSRLPISYTFENTHDFLGIPRVHLASESLHTEGQFSACFRSSLFNQFPCPCHKPGLAVGFLLGRRAVEIRRGGQLFNSFIYCHVIQYLFLICLSQGTNEGTLHACMQMGNSF